jgi:hypothetical protein
MKYKYTESVSTPQWKPGYGFIEIETIVVYWNQKYTRVHPYWNQKIKKHTKNESII